MKVILYGSHDQEPQAEYVTKLAVDIYETHALPFMVQNLHRIDFEVRTRISINYARLSI